MRPRCFLPVGRLVAIGEPQTMIRVILPQPLSALARIDREVTVEIQGAATPRAVIDALEAAYPLLRVDLSHEGPDAPLPEEVAEGREQFLIVGAMAGG